MNGFNLLQTIVCSIQMNNINTEDMVEVLGNYRYLNVTAGRFYNVYQVAGGMVTIRDDHGCTCYVDIGNVRKV